LLLVVVQNNFSIETSQFYKMLSNKKYSNSNGTYAVSCCLLRASVFQMT